MHTSLSPEVLSQSSAKNICLSRFHFTPTHFNTDSAQMWVCIPSQRQYCFFTNRVRLLISLQQGHILSVEKTGNRGHAHEEVTCIPPLKITDAMPSKWSWSASSLQHVLSVHMHEFFSQQCCFDQLSQINAVGVYAFV